MSVRYIGRSASMASGTGALTVTVPVGYALDDLLLIFAESENQDIALPSGWNLLFQIGTGTAATDTSTRLEVFYKWSTASEASVTVGDAGDHTTAVMTCWRGVDKTTPFDVTPSYSTVSGSTITFPSLTPVTGNCMVILVASLNVDAASTAQITYGSSTWVPLLTEGLDQTVISGGGGGLTFAYGNHIGKQATGTINGSMATNTNYAYGTILLRPKYTSLNYWEKTIVIPGTLPVGDGRRADFSSGDLYLGIASGEGTGPPYVDIYKRDKVDRYTHLPSALSAAPTANCRDISFSSDDSILTVAAGNTPYLYIYDRSGDTFTKRANPTVLPPGVSHSCGFSKTDTYIAVGTASSTFLKIYKNTAGDIQALTNPTTMPTAAVYDCQFSNSETYLAIGGTFTDYLYIYKRTGDTFAKLANPGTLPTGQVLGLAWSPNDKYLVVAHDTSPFITIYLNNGDDTFTKLANPSALPFGSGRGANFSRCGMFLAVAAYGTPSTVFYQVNYPTNTFNEAQPMDVSANGNGFGVHFSKSGATCIGLSGTTPYMRLSLRDLNKGFM